MQKLVCGLVLSYLEEGLEEFNQGLYAREGKEHFSQVGPEMTHNLGKVLGRHQFRLGQV